MQHNKIVCNEIVVKVEVREHIAENYNTVLFSNDDNN